ncbi:MAG: desulfoferrodoxin family protein [Candidatus Omnitrophica bacterium]|nr:desulfoferrodoxin family protein [Candidatus Omnitrophota bacterium]
MKAYVCKMCSFISINGSAPEKCPVCGAPQKAFEEKGDAIKTPKDPNNPSDFEKKHIPAITVVKKCGLIPEGCQDVHVKVGEIQHPMQADHYIVHIDFYIDKEFISRVILTPDKLNPAAALHLKTPSGTLTAIELCNLHGAWINEEEL